MCRERELLSQVSCLSPIVASIGSSHQTNLIYCGGITNLDHLYLPEKLKLNLTLYLDIQTFLWYWSRSLFSHLSSSCVDQEVKGFLKIAGIPVLSFRRTYKNTLIWSDTGPSLAYLSLCLHCSSRHCGQSVHPPANTHHHHPTLINASEIRDCQCTTQSTMICCNKSSSMWCALKIY